MRNICRQNSHRWVWWGLAWALTRGAALGEEKLLLAKCWETSHKEISFSSCKLQAKERLKWLKLFTSVCYTEGGVDPPGNAKCARRRPAQAIDRENVRHQGHTRKALTVLVPVIGCYW